MSYHCPQDLFPSKQLLMLPVLGWTEKKDNSLLSYAFSMCAGKLQSRADLCCHSSLSALPVRAPGWREAKEGKHQTEILNILLACISFLIRFYLRTRTNTGKRGKNLLAILPSHSLLQLVWKYKATPFLGWTPSKAALGIQLPFQISAQTSYWERRE